MAAIALSLAAIGGVGLALNAAGLASAWHFGTQLGGEFGPAPPMTVLRPLCGAEPGLEAALASTLCQMGPGQQAIFGVQNPADPAIAVVRRLQARLPALDITLVIDATPHGGNRKIGNLINMLPHAKHELLVFCDSDLHVPAGYLARLAEVLAEPGVGLATTVCLGLPTGPGWVARLGATGISHGFTPAALMARWLGRQDCLGTTMALRRQTLAAVGGLAMLRDHLADDNVLGQLVQGLGLKVALARTVPLTGVAEARLADLWRHEMRWARTIRALEPFAYAGTFVLYPLVWAMLAVAAAPGWRSAGFFLLAWGLRAMMAGMGARCLAGQRAPAVPVLLLPIRDVVSFIEVGWAFVGSRVVWRGRVMTADAGAPVIARL